MTDDRERVFGAVLSTLDPQHSTTGSFFLCQLSLSTIINHECENVTQIKTKKPTTMTRLSSILLSYSSMLNKGKTKCSRLLAFRPSNILWGIFSSRFFCWWRSRVVNCSCLSNRFCFFAVKIHHLII